LSTINGWVINASPLIVLAKIEHLHLLQSLSSELVIPRAVAVEIEAGPVGDPARRFLTSPTLPVVDVAIEPLVQSWDLGAGETAVLSYAWHNRGWGAVVDDGMARRCAQVLSIPIVGTLGIILRARHRGLIPAAVPVLRQLQAQGFHLDVKMLPSLVESVGEKWE